MAAVAWVKTNGSVPQNKDTRDLWFRYLGIRRIANWFTSAEEASAESGSTIETPQHLFHAALSYPSDLLIGGDPQDVSIPTVETLFLEAAAGSDEAFHLLCKERLPQLKTWLETECRGRRIPDQAIRVILSRIVAAIVECIKRNNFPPQDKEMRELSIKYVGMRIIANWLTRRCSLTRLEPAPDLKLVSEDDPRALQTCMECLIPEQQEILKHFLEGSSVEEAGEKMGLSLVDSQNLYHAALGHLSEFLEDWELFVEP